MACTWDSGNAGAGMNLCRGSLCAGKNASNGSWQSIRGTTGKTTGKVYLEFYINSYDQVSSMIVGVCNTSASMSNWVGVDANSFGLQLNTSTTWNYVENATNRNTLWTVNKNNAQGAVIGLAIDIGNSLVWWRTDRGTNWNNNGSADPASGTGGLTQFISFTTLYPAMSAIDASDANCATLNTGGMPFAYAAPSGFSAWDSGALTLGNGFLGTFPTTWNPADKQARVTLTNGNLTATRNDSFAEYDGVRATSSRGKGQFYLEQTAALIDSGNTAGWIGGFGTSGSMLGGTHGVPGGDALGIGAQSHGGAYLFDNSVNGQPVFTWAAPTQGDVLGFAVDLTKGLLWVKDITAAGNWNANASADPVAGILGVGVPFGDNIYPMWGGGDGTPAASGWQTLTNFGASSFSGSLPSGYAAWDATGADPWVDDVKTRGLVLPPLRHNQSFDYGSAMAAVVNQPYMNQITWIDQSVRTLVLPTPRINRPVSFGENILGAFGAFYGYGYIRATRVG
jgi:hypothetical protein